MKIFGVWLPNERGDLVPMTLDSLTGETEPVRCSAVALERRIAPLHLSGLLQRALERIARLFQIR